MRAQGNSCPQVLGLVTVCKSNTRLKAVKIKRAWILHQSVTRDYRDLCGSEILGGCSFTLINMAWACWAG